jgi:hypothetical protein
MSLPEIGSLWVANRSYSCTWIEPGAIAKVIGYWNNRYVRVIPLEGGHEYHFTINNPLGHDFSYVFNPISPLTDEEIIG